MTSELVPVHVGLMGHIDHGKTALAAVLSDGVYTAGLDKHPQARQRGITIDLGFTMFRVGSFLVTLVDAPGHADLIRSVVAGANIIDMAILVVAADEGPKVQTGEHLIVLQSVGITTLLVAITKTDLVTPERVNAVESQMRSIVGDLPFDDVRFVCVSAKTGDGVDELRSVLGDMLSPRPRDNRGPFMMPIDHAFPVRGHGTVVTGTILRGRVEVNDTVEMSPGGERTRVRAIQTFGSPRNTAQAGDRVGINVPELDHRQIHRGDYLSTPDTLTVTDLLVTKLHRNPLYKGSIRSGMIVSAHIGMCAVTSEIQLLSESEGRHVLLDEATENSFTAILRTKRPVAAENGMHVLLLRTDLPPTSMRIVASGVIDAVEFRHTLYRRRTRRGAVQRTQGENVFCLLYTSPSPRD